MAKAVAHVKCKDCGCEIVKEVKRSSRKEADQWQHWAEYLTDWQCSNCWGVSKRKKETERGFVLEIEINNNPISHAEGQQELIRLAFAGDTYSHKDDIKSIGGYVWSNKHSTGFLGALSASSPRKAWIKFVSAEELEKEVEAAKAIGATIENHIEHMDILMHEAINEMNKKGS